MFDALGEAVIITDLEGRVVLWNRAAEQLYGWQAAEAIGQNIVELTPSDLSREQATEIMARLSRGETWEGEFVVRHRDGTPFAAWVSDGPYLDDAGELAGVIGLSRALGVARSIENHLDLLVQLSASLGTSLDYAEAVKQVTAALAPAFADICTIIILDEADGPRRMALTSINGAKETLHEELGRVSLSPRVAELWERTLSGRRAELVPDLLAYLSAGCTEKDAYTAAIERLGIHTVLVAPLVARGKASGVLTFGMLARTGRKFVPADTRFAEALGHRVGLAIDNARVYTRLRASEAEAKEAYQRARAAEQRKDEFLAMLGHELRNPLAPIVTALSLMRLRRQPSREEEIIRRQTTHLVRLVDDLLDVARITRGNIDLKRQRLEIALTIHRAIEIASPLIELRSHHLAIDVPSAGLTVDGDPTRLAQIVSNLLVNAAKYTEPGGHIRVRAWRDDDTVAIAITDDGIGISAEALGDIFEPFVQGHQAPDRPIGGLGIGLTLVRNFVEAHGGAVAAASGGLGRGTELVVRLPFADPGTEAPPVPPSLDPAEGVSTDDRLRVLVVDDNDDAAEVTAEALRHFGHEIITAGDGPTALRIAASFRPDVAVLDIGLPVMDGFELAQELRLLTPALRLVAVTGYGQPEDRARGEKAGFAAYLVKPIDLDALMRAIARKA